MLGKLQQKLWLGHKDADKEICDFLKVELIDVIVANDKASALLYEVDRYTLDVCQEWIENNNICHCFAVINIPHCARLVSNNMDVYYCFFDRVYKDEDYIPVFAGRDYIDRNKYVERMKSYSMHTVCLYLDTYLDRSNSVFAYKVDKFPLYPILAVNVMPVWKSPVSYTWRDDVLYLKGYLFEFETEPINILEVEGMGILCINTLFVDFVYIESYNLMLSDDDEPYEPVISKDKRNFLMSVL